MPDDRPPRPNSGFRDQRPGGFRPAPSGPRAPYGGPPRTSFSGTRPGVPEPSVSIRVRDGDRELEVHGPAAFCRQIVDELPVLLARLTGEPGTPANRPSIALPPPPAGDARASGPPAEPEPVAEAAPEGAGSGSGDQATVVAVPVPVADPNGGEPSALEGEVLSALRGARRAITIAELRSRLVEEVSGQAVRRILERSGDRVVNVGGRPAAYRAR